jgi:2-polyprenyl-6-hydroxyphenyl methylase/3-demethylubiquinone-9 3-methyltransferase
MVEKWFGENWLDYVKGIDEKAVAETRDSLLRYLPEKEWKGKHFIDIGCGSGMFSLGALSLGVGKVTSIDIDEKSIEATKLTKARFGARFEKKWEIIHGSILDDLLAKKLKDSGDIVYAWGSLHHTGNMRKAINNAAAMVKPGGQFILAIYNRAATSEEWHKIKDRYSKLPNAAKPLIELPYATAATLGYMVKRKTLDIRKDRGMDVFHDAIDWMRGYPYEFAGADEMTFLMERAGFKLIKTPTILPHEKEQTNDFFRVLRAKNVGCNEFVFKRIG